MDVEKRLEQLHKELEQFDKEQNNKNKNKLLNAKTEKLINLYTKLCNKAQKKEDDKFIQYLKRNQFILNVSRIIPSSEEDDLLSTYLNTLKSQEIISMIHSVHIYDESESVKKVKKSNISRKSQKSNNNTLSKTKENKKTIGNRILKAIYTFLRNELKDNNGKLRSVQLRGIQIETKKNWQLFGGVICKILSLKELILHNVPLYDDGCHVLCNFLKNSKLNKLVVSNCGLTSVSGAFIGRLIVYHSNNRLSLEWQNKLRIKENEHENTYNTPNFDPIKIGLTSIDLSENNLCDHGLNLIAKILENNTSLLWMDLRSNNITKYGVINVIKMLKKNTNLLHFDLTKNKDIPLNVTSEIFTILQLRRKENNKSLSIKQKSVIQSLLGQSRNLSMTQTPRISVKSSKKISRRNSKPNSLKHTPSTKIFKVSKSKKVRKQRHNMMKLKKTKQIVTKQSKQRQINKKRGKPTKIDSTKIDSTNEIVQKILTDLKYYETTYKSTKNECDKLKKQNKRFQEKIKKMEKLKQNIDLTKDNNSVTESVKTISEIIDSLENAFKKINLYIDTIENSKNLQNIHIINTQDLTQNNQESVYDESFTNVTNDNYTEAFPAKTYENDHDSDYQQHAPYYIESDNEESNDHDSYIHHNAIEQRLREIWDSRLVK